MAPAAEFSNPESDAVNHERLQPVRQMSNRSADSLYKEVGFLIDDFPNPTVLADALMPDCPIVGASNSFVGLSGYKRQEILGRNCRFLLKDVPGCCISRSGRKNLRSMIRMCRLIGLSTMGSTSCCQTNRKRDGETFLNTFAVGLVLINEHPFLVGVLSPCSETGGKEEMTRLKQDHHALIEQTRIILQQGLSESNEAIFQNKSQDFLLPRPRALTGPAFSSGSLTERVILLNNRRTVMRREPCEIPNGCVVISEQPVRRTRLGIFFAVRLEGVLRDAWHTTWPVLGLTQFSPDEMVKKGYPMRAEWCGKSVCIGGNFQASYRDKSDHWKGAMKTSADELTSFDGPRPRWQNRPHTPWDLEEGDVMGMLYTPQGTVHLMLNYQTVLSVDTGKPLQNVDYHALVDCQGQAYELLLLPYTTPVKGHMDDLALQPLLSHKVIDFVARNAASRAVSSCTFSVSIADPSQPDVPLVAVSPAFETMTGYTCEEVVGMNCRFLNHECEIDFQQRRELRRCCQSGKPFTCVLQNRRRSGEVFLNLLDLCGLSVAKDAETGENIWYLVGIQSDVTNLIDRDGNLPTGMKEAHARELQALAEHLRRELQVEIAELAISATPGLVQTPSQENSSIPEDGAAEDEVVAVPATPGIERGPKPSPLPMIAMLPEASWIRHDTHDHNGEPEQVDKRGPQRATSGASHVWRLWQTCMSVFEHRWWPYAACGVGVVSALLYQVSKVQRKAS
eukprot:TRINITY_DN10849_c0_g1_i1.p1 TRINITY_DN10849_c0_g1~~TRINITY_DN10849_c0_g1_i1.p1  ORF type:complete len:734 (-),score=117.68 TRINITY_DN10849_c0_g1_i1:15-2216(-)